MKSAVCFLVYIERLHKLDTTYIFLQLKICNPSSSFSPPKEWLRKYSEKHLGIECLLKYSRCIRNTKTV